VGDLVSRGEIARDEIVIATKGGYLAFEGEPPSGRQELADYVQKTFIAPGVIGPGELVAGVHCMSPSYLRDQIRRSLANLGVGAIDVYYLHNPEQQLSEVPRAEFERRLRAAFETLEEAAAEGKIGVYGTATWNGYRANPESRGYLSLASLVAIAREIGGEKHRFRVVQLPYNLGMHEAFTLANQKLEVDGRTGWTSFLEAARGFGITVMASASMLQGRLAHGLPEELEQAFPGLDSDARRAIQFVRSTPGITTALVGMKQPSHVEENLGLLGVPPAGEKHLMKLFQSASRQKGT
jgi:aryl-alcohol dehydrogenase-like predicted oxidoreductase